MTLCAHRWAAAAGTHAARRSGEVAVRAISAAKRPLLTAMLAGTETVRTAAAGLPNRELGERTCRRRLAFGARKRRTNQRAVNRPFFPGGILVIVWRSFVLD